MPEVDPGRFPTPKTLRSIIAAWKKHKLKMMGRKAVCFHEDSIVWPIVIESAGFSEVFFSRSSISSVNPLSVRLKLALSPEGASLVTL